MISILTTLYGSEIFYQDNTTNAPYISSVCVCVCVTVIKWALSCSAPQEMNLTLLIYQDHYHRVFTSLSCLSFPSVIRSLSYFFILSFLPIRSQFFTWYFSFSLFLSPYSSSYPTQLSLHMFRLFSFPLTFLFLPLPPVPPPKLQYLLFPTLSSFHLFYFLLSAGVSHFSISL